MRLCAIPAAALALGAAAAAAQQVSLAGSIGESKALLMIDGRPRTLAVGESAQGVTLRQVGDGAAEVEVGGRVVRLRLGAAPARAVAEVEPVGATGVVLPVGPGGHVVTEGTIDGRSVRFLVDTGASTVALSEAEASRIGLDWRRGARAFSQTANGVVAVHALTLSSVRVGGVEVANVAAVVVPAELPMVLLGNSFLGRFTMRRDNDVMRLDKKP